LESAAVGAASDQSSLHLAGPGTSDHTMISFHTVFSYTDRCTSQLKLKIPNYNKLKRKKSQHNTLCKEKYGLLTNYVPMIMHTSIRKLTCCMICSISRVHLSTHLNGKVLSTIVMQCKRLWVLSR